MYQFVLGKISTLSADPLASTLADMAPQGARYASWLAGRTLLARTLSPSPLPEIIYGEQGKPAFANGHPLWFNLSHSGDDIAMLISDEGEVGCDIEVFSASPNMTSWNVKRRKSSFPHSGASGHAKRRSSNSVAAARGRLSALTAPPSRSRSASCASAR